MSYYSHITAGCFADAIGDELGLNHNDFSALIKQGEPVISDLRQKRDNGEMPLLSLRVEAGDILDIEKISEIIKNNFANLVILGTGGSTLSGQALYGFTSLENNLNGKKPAIYFADNIDPESFGAFLDKILLLKTCFLVISKSGTTMETLAQFGACLKKVEDQIGQEKIKEHFVIITDPTDNPLRRAGKNFDIKTLDHQPKIGGRFSAFTNVGLLPACVAGLDIRSLRRGANNAIKSCLEGETDKSEPLLGAALNVLMEKNGISNNILMPYIDRLVAFTNLQRQIWAESLGKGGNGTMPIRALGTLDQHSQMQLYLDGPRNKLFTFIIMSKQSTGAEIKLPDDKETSYLSGKTIGNIMKASAQATIETMQKNNLPIRYFELAKLDEEVLGALIMHFMLETIIAGKLIGINPFDQPAVEAGKIRARELLVAGGD